MSQQAAHAVGSGGHRASFEQMQIAALLMGIIDRQTSNYMVTPEGEFQAFEFEHALSSYMPNPDTVAKLKRKVLGLIQRDAVHHNLIQHRPNDSQGSEDFIERFERRVNLTIENTDIDEIRREIDDEVFERIANHMRFIKNRLDSGQGHDWGKY